MEVMPGEDSSLKPERLKIVGKRILESITIQFLQVRIDKPVDYPKFHAQENNEEADAVKEQEA